MKIHKFYLLLIIFDFLLFHSKIKKIIFLLIFFFPFLNSYIDPKKTQMLHLDGFMRFTRFFQWACPIRGRPKFVDNPLSCKFGLGRPRALFALINSFGSYHWAEKTEPKNIGSKLESPRRPGLKYYGY